MEVLISSKKKNFMRAPPRSPTQLLNALRVFKEVDGLDWGFGSKLSETEKHSRLIVASKLLTKTFSKNPLGLARNYEATLSKLGFLYVNEKGKLNVTEAGKIVLDPKYREVVFLEQFIKFRSFEMNRKRTLLEASEDFPFQIAIDLWLQSENLKILPFDIIRDKLFGRHNLNTATTYTDVFLKIVEATSIIFYSRNKGYAVLLEPKQAEELLSEAKNISKTTWEKLKFSSIGLDDFFEIYGKIKYIKKLERFIIPTDKRIKLVQKIIRPKQRRLDEFLAQKIQTPYNRQIIGKELILEAKSELKRKGLETRDLEEYVARPPKHKKKEKVKQKREEVFLTNPENINNILFTQVREEELGFFTDKMNSLLRVLANEPENLPIIVAGWYFDPFLKWFLWALNQYSWIERAIPAIPVKFMYLSKLIRIAKKSRVEFLEMLYDFHNSALTTSNQNEWMKYIENKITQKYNEITKKIQTRKKENNSVKKVPRTPWIKKLIQLEKEYKLKKPKLFDDEFYDLEGKIRVSEETDSFAELIDEIYNDY